MAGSLRDFKKTVLERFQACIYWKSFHQVKRSNRSYALSEGIDFRSGGCDRLGSANSSRGAQIKIRVLPEELEEASSDIRFDLCAIPADLDLAVAVKAVAEMACAVER